MDGKGTPKTLKGAIENGFKAMRTEECGEVRQRDVDVMLMHVKDFLSQKFNVAMIAEEIADGQKKELESEKLWKSIVE